jgi:hypothetical protein
MQTRSVFVAVAAALAVTIASASALAQSENPNQISTVSDGVKGAVGLGLLGADVTLIIEGACRVRNPWLLSVIPIVVAGGGAAGGYYAGRESTGGAVAMLISGLALIIPAAILVAHGRAYHSQRDDEGFVDRTEEGEPMSDDEGSAASENGTETEVVGPEESGDTETEPQSEPAPTPAPTPAPEQGGQAPESGQVSSLGAPAPSAAPSSMRLIGHLQVRGVLAIVAEQWSADGAPMLSLRYF